jgi:hypothetical protein
MLLLTNQELSQCSKCLKLLPRESFYVRKESGRLGSVCKLCWSIKTDEWKKKNPEKRRAIALKWAKAHYPYIRECKARYRAKDPLRMRKWSIENPEKKKLLNKLWSQKNKPRILATVRARQCQKLKATPPWSNLEEIRSIYVLAAKQGMHVDHVIPLRHPLVCGLHVPANLQLMTPHDNYSKSNRWNP